MNLDKDGYVKVYPKSTIPQIYTRLGDVPPWWLHYIEPNIFRVNGDHWLWTGPVKPKNILLTGGFSYSMTVPRLTIEGTRVENIIRWCAKQLFTWEDEKDTAGRSLVVILPDLQTCGDNQYEGTCMNPLHWKFYPKNHPEYRNWRPKELRAHAR